MLQSIRNVLIIFHSINLASSWDLISFLSNQCNLFTILIMISKLLGDQKMNTLLFCVKLFSMNKYIDG